MRNEPPDGALGRGLDEPVGGPPPRTDSDKDITLAVREALFVDPELSEHDFEVSTRDGVVTIAGQVKSEQLRQRALDIIWDLDGVRDVVADIGVWTS
jgi:osmotically-inducible protein OsmY